MILVHKWSWTGIILLTALITLSTQDYGSGLIAFSLLWVAHIIDSK